MSKTCGVYIITNVANGKRYIGSSEDVEKRVSKHFVMLANGEHKNPRLQFDYAVYGRQLFTAEMVCECLPEDRQLFERAAIHIFQPEYNMLLTDEGGCWKWDAEHNRHTSETMQGRVFPALHRQHISEAAKHRKKRH